MNIFVVDQDPRTAARSLVDRHVVKMVLETAQMMCSVFPEGEAPYRRTHYNHPCSVWTRERFANYEWLYSHGSALSSEFTFRFGKEHKSSAVIDWCWNNVSRSLFRSDGHITPFAQAMPDEYKDADPVVAYRRYYTLAKAHLHHWTRREEPAWINYHPPIRRRTRPQ
jgi:hypothetical protein